ncbi:hypothetical protein [Pseudomonas sp. UV AK001]|uniref:hypothetical protein n=1 Tax=Pseudomonas sp. UV AK001 TaxID=3384791 RepID=UPI0038D4DB56
MLKEPLSLIVFIHKDLEDYSKDELYDRHFSWFAEEMENISGRKMLIVLVRPSDAEEFSNHPYQNVDASISLKTWKLKIDNYRNSRTPERRDPRFNKFLLLTRHPINVKVLGIARRPGYVGIAATKEASTPAHEVGHMFNAVHEDGEVLYNGWWSETVMRETDEFSGLRHDANRFSDKNRENIRAYLDSENNSRFVRYV